MPNLHIHAPYEIGQPWEAWAPMARAYGPIRSEADMIRALRFVQCSSRELRENQEPPAGSNSTTKTPPHTNAASSCKSALPNPTKSSSSEAWHRTHHCSRRTKYAVAYGLSKTAIEPNA